MHCHELITTSDGRSWGLRCLVTLANFLQEVNTQPSVTTLFCSALAVPVTGNPCLRNFHTTLAGDNT